MWKSLEKIVKETVEEFQRIIKIIFEQIIIGFLEGVFGNILEKIWEKPLKFFCEEFYKNSNSEISDFEFVKYFLEEFAEEFLGSISRRNIAMINFFIQVSVICLKEFLDEFLKKTLPRKELLEQLLEELLKECLEELLRKWWNSWSHWRRVSE